jgi:hypothetical protein
VWVEAVRTVVDGAAGPERRVPAVGGGAGVRGVRGGGVFPRVGVRHAGVERSGAGSHHRKPSGEQRAPR